MPVPLAGPAHTQVLTSTLDEAKFWGELGASPHGTPFSWPSWRNWLAQRTFNPWVLGSSPRGGTTRCTRSRQTAWHIVAGTSLIPCRDTLRGVAHHALTTGNPTAKCRHSPRARRGTARSFTGILPHGTPLRRHEMPNPRRNRPPGILSRQAMERISMRLDSDDGPMAYSEWR